MTGHLSLKPEKLSELCGLIHTFRQRKRASRSQLESLAGKLCWASHVVPRGRTDLRSIYVLISSLKSPTHKCRLGDLQVDLTWWHYWLNNGENWRHIWPPTTALDVFTDACTDAGRSFCCGNLLYAHWANDVPLLTPHHINTKELAAVVMAAQAWSHVWANHHVVVFTDNRVTEAAVNNGTARNSTCLHFLKHLAALALQFNFNISAVYIPGVDNTIADTISRLHEPGKLNLLSSHLNVSVPCLLQSISMSAKSQHFLFFRASPEPSLAATRQWNRSMAVTDVCRIHKTNL